MSMALTAPPTRKRFLIVACLFIGIFIAYLDRVNVSVLAANEPFLAYMGIEGMPLQIGMMMTVFLAAYGIANVVLSPLGDYLGPRKAMMLCILIWTIALMIGGVATSFALIIICRILLGIGEGFYYPLQSVFIKNWFPKQERGRAGNGKRRQQRKFYVAGKTGDYQLLLLVAGAVVPVSAMPVLGDDYLAANLS